MNLKSDLPTPFDCTATLAPLARRASVSRLIALGDLDLLRNETLALFCSARCPGSLILKFYDALCATRGKQSLAGFVRLLNRKDC
jgi:hypothetical protein